MSSGYMGGNLKGHLSALLCQVFGWVPVIPRAPWARGHPAEECLCSLLLTFRLWGGRRCTVRSQTQEGSQGALICGQLDGRGPWSLWGVEGRGSPPWALEGQ